MGKPQYLALTSAFVLFAGLYFGFSTKTSHPKAEEATRPMSREGISTESLVAEAKSRLSASQLESILQLETDLSTEKQGNIEKKVVDALKTLSSKWYEVGEIPIAGAYAEQVAGMENTDSSWSVAGGTFYNGLIAAKEPALRDYCASHAIQAFEQASLVNPQKVEHRVNIALIYAENPPADNPMKAVLMLRELEAKHPDNPSVYNALGRLAIKTGQWQRAIDRLEKAYSLDPKNPNTPCLLAKAYEGADNTTKANEFARKCNQK